MFRLLMPFYLAIYILRPVVHKSLIIGENNKEGQRSSICLRKRINSPTNFDRMPSYVSICNFDTKKKTHE